MATPVEEIKERLNIVDVVQEYVPLKKAGANHKGRCPFHNEKTPSFTVSESKQFFHCFGCGKGGDVFTFIEQAEGVEFAEALRMLAAKANVELRPTNPREHNERTRILDCLTSAADFYATTLRTAPQAQRARDYLAQRSVTQETTTTFHLGYSPDSWDALITHLHTQQFTDREIEHAGLSIRSPKTKGYYDRFRSRLMFPIHNAHGNVIGFGARTLDPNQKEAKYINSPQTPVYNKSAVLYAIHMAKPFIQKMDAAVIMEGYMDVITAHQAKFRNVVAASGTALTHEQIRLLKRYSNNVILAFDADAAGLSAAWRGMQVAIQEGMNIKVLVLPPGQDPDDLIKQDPQEFRNRAIAAKPFMEHAFDTVITPLDLTNVLHKKKAAQELLPMIAQFPDAIEQTHYIQKLATMLNVEAAVLEEKINTLKKAARRSANVAAMSSSSSTSSASSNIQQPAKDYLTTVVERLLAMVSLLPQEFGTVQSRIKPEDITNSTLQALYKSLVDLYNRTGSLDVKSYMPTDPATAAQWNALQLIGEEYYGPLTIQEQQQELLSLVESIERHSITARLKSVQQQLARAERAHDTAAVQQLSEEFRRLTELLRQCD